MLALLYLSQAEDTSLLFKEQWQKSMSLLYKEQRQKETKIDSRIVTYDHRNTHKSTALRP